jgi:hypothetical protein
MSTSNAVAWLIVYWLLGTLVVLGVVGVAHAIIRRFE